MPKGEVFISPEGETKYFLESQFDAAIREGWRPKSDDRGIMAEFQRRGGAQRPLEVSGKSFIQQASEAGEARAEAEFGDRTGQALALGAASGLTFGLSDLALEKLDLADVKDIRRYNPGAYMTGEFGTILGTSLLTAGSSLGKIGTGLAKFTPAGRVSRATAELGRKVGGVQGMMAAEGLEGMAYGVGQGVSKLAITDEPLTAESISSELLRDGLLGGVMGAATGGLMGGIQKVVRARKGLSFDGTPKFLDHGTDEGKAFLGQMGDAAGGLDDIGGDLLGRHGMARDVKKIRADIEFDRKEVMDRLRIARNDADNWYKEAQGILSKEADLGDVDLSVVNKYQKVLREEADAIRSQLSARGGTMPGGGSPYDSLLKAEQAYRSAVSKKNPALIAKSLQEYESAIGSMGKRLGRDSAREVQQNMNRLGLTDPIADIATSDRAVYLGSLRQAVKEMDAARALVRSHEEGKILRLTQLGKKQDFGAAHAALSAQHANAAANLGRVLGKNVDVADDVARNIREIVPQMAWRNQVVPKIKPGSFDADELIAARGRMRAALGVSDGSSIGGQDFARLFKKSQAEQIEAFQALGDYDKVLQRVAKAQGTDELARAHADQMGRLMDAMAESVPNPEMVKGIEWGDLAAAGVLEAAAPNIDGPIDDIAKLVLAHKIMQSQVVKRGSKAAGGLMDQILKGAVRRGAGQAGWKLVPGSGPGAAVVAGGASAAAGGIANKVLSRLHGGAELFGAAGRATAGVADTVASLAGKAGRGVARSPVGSVAAIKLLNLGDNEDSDDLQKQYKAKSEKLSQMMGDPWATQNVLNEAIAPVRQAHDGVGDKLEMQMMRTLQFLHDKMPKDPSAITTLGKSRWKPSDLAVRKWARYVQAATDPQSVMASVANGTITPEAAEALRTLYPVTFGALQMEIYKNAETLQDNLNYDQKIRLSILFDQPIDSVMRPKFRRFVMQHTTSHAEQQIQQGQQAAAQARSMPAKPETPTKAQSLLR